MGDPQNPFDNSIPPQTDTSDQSVGVEIPAQPAGPDNDDLPGLPPKLSK